METRLFEMGNNKIPQWKYYSILLKFHHGKKIITMEFVMGNNKIPQWKM